jgi:cyclic-di-AMP phosphodiesterase PgpH
MARETNRSGGAKSGRLPVRNRRALFRRERDRTTELADAFFRSPTRVWSLLIWGGFILVCSVMAMWARQQPLVAVGRVMNFTALARVPFAVEDRSLTEQRRAQARQRTPRVYVPQMTTIESIRVSVENLPRTLAAVEELEQVAPELRRQLGLTAESFQAIRGEVIDSEVTPVWRERTEALIEGLMRRPVVDGATYQRELNEGAAAQIELRISESAPVQVERRNLVSIQDVAQLSRAMTELAQGAGFQPPALGAIVSRLVATPEPTYAFDESHTEERRAERADATQPELTSVTAGQVIFRRTEVLTPEALDRYETELKVFQAEAPRWRVWLRSMSISAAVTAIGMAIAGYLTLFNQRTRHDPRRAGVVAALLALALGVAVVGTVSSPGLLMLTAIAPTVFVAVVVVVAYGQRVALAMGALHAVLVCIALDQPIGVYALMLTGISFAVLELRDIQGRGTIMRMGGTAGIALAIGAVLVALIDRPIVQEVFYQTLVDAVLAGIGGVSVGVITLAILPGIERLFGVTTGMTLIELRDPKQPLLKQLQQRAPGTYNHSLNVASIAEAAADAIGADARLTYVGALYHDIGKMNKPEYFVENQVGGPSKHDKLSPAMSLLVIVGHVKDGMAMAEEYNLPDSLRHFIEGHHGTTLVEFFYQRARKQAEQTAAQGKGAEEPDLPEEIEYRYPGPRPRTKEVAILMLADAVESATRTMVEPTPSRIDALVRAIANKRLMDGQFDDCELTLRDLQTIEDSISKSVASIYHGRVMYPSTAGISGGGKEERRA